MASVSKLRREETVDYVIKGLWHSIARMYNNKATPHNMTTSIGFVLLNIDSKEGTPATKIAPLMGLESRSLTRMLKNMEDRGFIYRKKDPDDGRSVRIFLTPTGREKREVATKTVKEFNYAIQQNIDKEQLKNFFATADLIGQIVDDL